ncbi:MAG TPA: class I SAM-dependent methyltransferase [Chitinophagaceae bacterium]|nr:class I SAM-dependent methyltransferase [Chitinophagaceae bacterium]
MKDQKEITREQHWEKVYRNKPMKEVSWYEPFPAASFSIIEKFHLPLHSAIIDVGGGDCQLTESLLHQGYTNITVLDISSTVIDRAKKRIGPMGDKVKWIVNDILDFKPPEKYILWHDRATFHFLVDDQEKNHYLEIANRAIAGQGYLVLSTFAINGPDQCSGLPVERYSQEKLSGMIQKFFKKIKCITEDHLTPSRVLQQFLVCSFLHL